MVWLPNYGGQTNELQTETSIAKSREDGKQGNHMNIFWLVIYVQIAYMLQHLKKNQNVFKY